MALSAMGAMMNYEWPGNVRELKNCVDRMVAFNSGPLLHFADLPTGIANDAANTVAKDAATEQPAMAMAAAASGGGAGWPGMRVIPGGVTTSSVVPLHQVERRAIEQALTYTHGDRTSAANLLGIGRTTLYRKLKEYGYPPGGAGTPPIAGLPPAA